ncbi:MAG: hypothetical protein MZU97_08570 [Bacillus subtilis]|nr:hypothetical protein [Bacillus subtilis]
MKKTKLLLLALSVILITFLSRLRPASRRRRPRELQPDHRRNLHLQRSHHPPRKPRRIGHDQSHHLDEHHLQYRPVHVRDPFHDPRRPGRRLRPAERAPPPIRPSIPRSSSARRPTPKSSPRSAFRPRRSRKSPPVGPSEEDGYDVTVRFSSCQRRRRHDA